ncbi:hypothetical protein AB0D08_26625 [Kitasatospora sp. NPDC048540]|uniref:hypothetical protein n=1 Tax=Kitasatospora sp. NPDC048540 TaxID=3155634 RepID=UPI0033C0CD6C
MTAPTSRTAARPRRAVGRGVALVLALLLPVIGPAATVTRAAADTPVMSPPDSVASLSLSRNLAAVAPALAEKIAAQTQTEAEIDQMGKEVVAEAERIAKEAADVSSADTALDAKAAAVNAETDSHNQRATSLSGRIDAHNAAKPPSDQPAAVNRYNAEAAQLEAEQNQVQAEETKIEGEQSEIKQEEAQLNSRKSQLNAASQANAEKASAARAKAQQLQLQTQQLLEEMAQLLQSLTRTPPDPAATMDQGGDAPAPPEPNAEAQGSEADTADSPYRQPQTSAMQQYAQQTGTTLDARPGTAYLTPEAVKRLPAAQAATLTSPAITYDGLVRKPNGHYTALRVQAPTTTATATASPTPAPAPAPTGFDLGGLVTFLNGGQVSIDGLETLQEAPASSDSGQGHGNPSTGASGNPRVPTCKDLEPSNAVPLNGGGWVVYLPSDAQNRNQGVNACLEGEPDSERGDDAAGNIRGWSDAQARATALGFTPKTDLARCHSVPRMAGGTADERNLTPCFQRGANINQRTGGKITNSMRTFEARAGVDMGQGPVLYNVLPQYKTTTSTIPNTWDMSLYAWSATTGSTTDSGWTVVDNSSYGPSGLAYLGN